MPTVSLGKPISIWEYQAPATLDQAAPVQNTWYTILDTTLNARLLTIAVNVEDTNEDLQVQVIVDGETIEANSPATCVHSTRYFCTMTVNPITLVDYIELTPTVLHYFRSFILEGKSTKVQVRKTTANGTGNLTGIVTYGVKKVAA